jgi:hypothetical protein
MKLISAKFFFENFTVKYYLKHHSFFKKVIWGIYLD